MKRLKPVTNSMCFILAEACNVNSQFLCESRLECLSLGLICDGVVDCNDTQTDEVNCKLSGSISTQYCTYL